MKTAAIALVIVALLTPAHTRQARRSIHAFRSSHLGLQRNGIRPNRSERGHRELLRLRIAPPHDP
jgi:hypothetical protein